MGIGVELVDGRTRSHNLAHLKRRPMPLPDTARITFTASLNIPVSTLLRRVPYNGGFGMGGDTIVTDGDSGFTVACTKAVLAA
jgi:hypothetical protein